MHLIPHLLRKDLRAMRWPVFILAVGLTAIALLRYTPFVGGGALAQVLIPLVAVILGALAVALTAAAVQEDNLVTTTAFWRTRPFGRGRLLAAKLAFLLLVPVPSFMPLFLVSPSGAPGMAALLAISVVLATAAVAAIASDLKHFLWGAALVAFAYVAVYVSCAEMFWHPHPITLGRAPFAVALLTTGAISGLTLVHHYFGGRRLLSLLLLAAAVVAGPVLAFM